jgi:hypothetical protein
MTNQLASKTACRAMNKIINNATGKLITLFSFCQRMALIKIEKAIRELSQLRVQLETTLSTTQGHLGFNWPSQVATCVNTAYDSLAKLKPIIDGLGLARVDVIREQKKARCVLHFGCIFYCNFLNNLQQLLVIF